MANVIDKKWEEVKTILVSETADEKSVTHAKTIFLMGAAVTLALVQDKTAGATEKLRKAFLENLAKQLAESIKEVSTIMQDQEKGEG